jgi:hypothetical protein
METSSAAAIEIENCVSNLVIEADAHPSVSASEYLDFGGLIGCKRANVVINNSYATGTITASAHNGRMLAAGGLVGRNDSYALTINNSYATGAIVLTKSEGTAGNFMYAGGLIGYNKVTAAISDSAALNFPSITFNDVGANKAANRIVGYGSATFQNNNARSDMVVGVAGSAGTVTGAAGDANGADKTAAQFTATTTWEALNFSQDIWDFSTIAEQGRPVLR